MRQSHSNTSVYTSVHTGLLASSLNVFVKKRSVDLVLVSASKLNEMKMQEFAAFLSSHQHAQNILALFQKDEMLRSR